MTVAGTGVLVAALAACGGGSDDEVTASDAASEPATELQQPGADPVGADDKPPDDDEGAQGSGSTASGTGTATVVHDGTTYTFSVVLCATDVPGADQRDIEFLAGGVPVDTPPDVAAEFRKLSGVDWGGEPLAVAMELGPVLTVLRVQDGGDQLVVLQLPDLALSSESSLADDERFLEIDGDSVTATVDADDGGTLQLDLSCP